MKFLRNNWFDLGAVLAVIVLVYVFFSHHVMADLAKFGITVFTPVGGVSDRRDFSGDD